ncbi:LDB1 protein, partial [Corythaeola cristata]|nr:LDB1 protein [Corythaeola cristata]
LTHVCSLSPGCSSKSFKLYSPKEPPNGNAFPPFHPGTMLDRDVGPTPMYPPTYLEPGIGRHTPYGNQTDYRIFELNKRLQNWTEECDNLWWDAFTTEFFEDDAMLTITFCLEDGPKRYTIGRTLIPRYFRSIFEGGATELYYPARQQPSKRRKRKMSGGSTMSSGGGNTNNSNSKKKSPASTFALSSQVPDVMVVGEPTLMGGEFGDEDERLITRLENTQFDAANGIDDEDSFNNSPALGANSPWNSKPPSSQESKSENPTSQASQ